MFYEDKKLYNTIRLSPFRSEYDMSFQIKKRPMLQEILKNLKTIATKHDINKFDLNCQIPGLNIIGITGYSNTIHKVVHIELLDQYTTMKNTDNEPTGLMQLKLRLLEKFDEALIVV